MPDKIVHWYLVNCKHVQPGERLEQIDFSRVTCEHCLMLLVYPIQVFIPKDDHEKEKN